MSLASAEAVDSLDSAFGELSGLVHVLPTADGVARLLDNAETG
jgi:hypothetical protein